MILNDLWGRITGADKKKRIQAQQADTNNMLGDYVIIYPYGMSCNLPGDALIKLVGKDSAVPCNIDRPETERGEVAVFHPVTMAKIVFKNDGSIEVTAKDMNFTAENNININSNNMKITASSLQIDSTVTVNGDTAFAGALDSNGKNISDSHKHGGVQSGGSNTGAVT